MQPCSNGPIENHNDLSNKLKAKFMKQNIISHTAITAWPTAIATKACLLYNNIVEGVDRIELNHAYHVRPMPNIELASCHMATFVASDIQYAT